MSDYVPKTKDFTNAPLCLSGHGVTKVFGLGEKKTVAVDHVDFDFHEGEFVSIVGESGSGKTTLSKMLLGLLNQTEGEILFQGKPRDVSSHRKKKEYWRGIQAIFQDPFSSFNTFNKIDTVLLDCINMRGGKHLPKEKKIEMMTEACSFVNLKFAELTNKYPFELSGGMRQRVMIAMALACEPDILIADEPTTALDVTIQAQILELMQDLQKKLGMAVILVTHDLGVIADMCDNIIVMYGGRICERGTAREIFYNPKHEYTKGLLRSIPNVNNMKKKLVPIAGTPINMLNLPAGCAFCTRCDAAMKICLTEHPDELTINENHKAACWVNIRDRLMAEGGEGNV